MFSNGDREGEMQCELIITVLKQGRVFPMASPPGPTNGMDVVTSS